MIKEIKKLEEKFGKFKSDNNLYRNNCFNKAGDIYSFMLFKPVDNYLTHLNNAEKQLGCKLLPELCEFYKESNGFRLFNDSINIFGIDPSFEYEYFSDYIFEANIDYKVRYLSEKSKDLIIFGDYSNFLFCFKKNDFNKVIVIDKYNENIIHEFLTIKELLNYYFSYLINEYAPNGEKIHKNKDDIGTMFENRSYEKI